ncbi:MAG TPA: hypothetical protein VGA69_02215 [Nitriliruptorales bacterium]
MAIFRFTMNVSFDGVDEGTFDRAAGLALDELLRREASGVFRHARVLGRRDARLLKVILEFESAGLNAAHTFGFDQAASVIAKLGADVRDWYETPHVAVTEDDGTDEWDILVEELRSARITPSTASVEAVTA